MGQSSVPPNITLLYFFSSSIIYFGQKEVAYVTIGNPAFCLALYLTGVHFRGKLQHFGDVREQKSSVDQSELEK